MNNNNNNNSSVLQNSEVKAQASDTDILNKLSEAISSSISSVVDSSTASLSSVNNLTDVTNKTVVFVMDTLIPFLKPVPSIYSTEVLATQIYHLSIFLFILSILISILILSLLINIFVLIYSDKITNFFTNKYIRWYVKTNMRLIKFEVFCLGFTILYFMYNLSIGLQYIATHPILFPPQ